MHKKGFTFIELIIVTTILLLMGFTFYPSFSRFLTESSLKSESFTIQSNIDELTQKLKSGEIYDYFMYFEGGSMYYSSINNYSPYSIHFNSFSGATRSGFLGSTASGSNDVMYYKVFGNNKLINTIFINTDESAPISLSPYSSYNISGYYSGSILNTMRVTFMGENKDVFISGINTKKDKTGIFLSTVSFFNNKNTTYIKGSDGKMYSEVFLFITQGEAEIIYTLKN